MDRRFGKLRTGDVARKWRTLAERRREHLTELYRTGRWTKYYTEEGFLAVMRATVDTIERWDKIERAAEDPTEAAKVQSKANDWPGATEAPRTPGRVIG